MMPYSKANAKSREQCVGGGLMDAVLKSCKGLSLLVRLNGDTLFSAGTVVLGLLAGAFLGTAIFGY
jgi:hypothetical protein